MDSLGEKLAQIKSVLQDLVGGKQVLVLLLIVVTMLAIPLTVYLVKQRQEVRSKADSDGSLEFVNPPASKNKGERFDVDFAIRLSSGNGKQITGADINISYSNNLSLVGFEPNRAVLGETIVNPTGSSLNPVDRTTRYVAVDKSGGTPPGTFIALGKLTFDALDAGEARVSIADAQVVAAGSKNTLVIDDKAGENALKVTIAGPAVPPAGKPNLTVGNPSAVTGGFQVPFQWSQMQNPAGGSVRSVGLRVVKDTGSMGCSDKVVLDQWWFVTGQSSSLPTRCTGFPAAIEVASGNNLQTSITSSPLLPGTYYAALFNRDSDKFNCSLNCDGSATGVDLGGFTTTQSFTISCPQNTTWNDTTKSCVAPIGSPANLTASCPRPGTRANLSWSAVESAGSYKVQVKNATDSASVNSAIVNAPTATYSYSPLTPGVSYSFGITACRGVTDCGGETTQSFTCVAPVRGDVDNNGCLSDNDLSLIRKIVQKLSGYTALADLYPDNNADGAVDMRDYNVWQKIYAQDTANRCQ